MIDAAAGDPARLRALVARRLTGEPLAWITGAVEFCGVRVRVDPGVYVPRLHTEPLARRAVERLPVRGTAIDVCTGSGAIAKVMAHARPDACVVATDIDERAVSCARANGVKTYQGDLFAAFAAALARSADVVTAVVPYVPTSELSLLQRDTFTFESSLSYDGGQDGSVLLRRVIRGARRFLRPGGALLLELGGDQVEMIEQDLVGCGYVTIALLYDEDGDVRGIEGRAARLKVSNS